jgi:fatty acid desaturase
VARAGHFPATLLLIWFTAWYMSLQHELIHGHPTSRPWFNQLLGTLPLAVWYPYGLYRDSHLAHHHHHLLTQPVDDPESYYFTPQSWQRFAPGSVALFICAIRLSAGCWWRRCWILPRRSAARWRHFDTGG